jgi:hypothetical protein
MTVPREVAPVLVLGAGLMGAVLWSGIIGGRPAAAPPYILSQGLLMLIGFTLAARGAPRWSYSWLAFGIVATSGLLGSLVASDGDPSAAIAIVAVATGPVLAVVLSTTISVRSWGDAFTFLGLFLAGLVVTWLIVGPPGGSEGAATEGTIGQAVALLFVLTILGVVIGMAVLAWNRKVPEVALVLLASVLIVSAIGFEVMIPDTTDRDVDRPSFASFFSLYLFLAMATFAAGSVRRVFAGKGMIGPSAVPRGSSNVASGKGEGESDPDESRSEATQDGGRKRRTRRSRAGSRDSAAQSPRRRRRS